MNVLGTAGVVFYVYVLSFLEYIMNFKNLIYVNKEQTTWHELNQPQPLPIRVDKQYSYTRDKLYTLANSQSSVFKTDLTTYRKIRALKIHKRKRGRRAGTHVKNKIRGWQRWINDKNLVKVKSICMKHIRKTVDSMLVMTLNARSIKNKDVLISEYLEEENIDIAVITET